MTSVWKLFNLRRYRGGRNAEGDLGLDSSSPDRRRPRERHGQGLHCRHHHADDRDPHHGDSYAGHPCHREHRSEREPVQLDRIASEYLAGDGSNGGADSSGLSRLGLIRNDRLPGAVLQARARLLERLRGGSLEGSRQATTASGIDWDEFLVSDHSNASNSWDWEAEIHRQRSAPFAPNVEFEVQAVEAPTFHDASQKKTPGLDWEAFCSRQWEIFRNPKESDGIARESLECCICLERFRDGDGLIRLDCAHRFHPACLEPWLHTTGTCPYCRASV